MKEAISGIKHPAFRDAISLTKAGGREAVGRYLVEDADMVRQALAAPDATVFAVFSAQGEAALLERDCEAHGVPLYVLRGGLITKLIGTSYETASAAVAVVAQKLVPPESLLEKTPTRLFSAAKRFKIRVTSAYSCERRRPRAARESCFRRIPPSHFLGKPCARRRALS